MSSIARQFVTQAAGRSAATQPPRRSSVTIVVAVYAALYIAWAVSGIGAAGPLRHVLSSIAFVPLDITAAWWFLRASRVSALSADERRGQLFIAGMYVLTALGNLWWTYDAAVRGADPRYAGANLFFVGSYLAGIIGLSCYPVAPRAPRELRKFLLDAGAVIVACAALIWTFTVSPIEWSSQSVLQRTLDVAYPAACIITLALLCRLIMNRGQSAVRWDMMLLAGGLALQCGLDLGLAREFEIGSSTEPLWPCLVYPLSYIMMIHAAYRATLWRPGTAHATATLRAVAPVSLLPTIAGIAVYVALYWQSQAAARPPLGLLVAACIVLTGFVLARQMIGVRELAMLEAAQAAAEHQAKYEARSREGQKLESIGRLAGGVAHDFNNLLTTVLANSDFALSRLRPGDPAHEEVEDIRSAALRGATLVRQLLAFSRKSVITPVRLDVTRVLRDLERLLQGLAGDQVAVHLELAADLGRIHMDRGQFETVFVNLVSNARDAMPSQGGAVVISAQNVTIDEATSAALELPLGDYVAVAVHDSGVGIPPDVRPHIFEPFFSTKERGKGSGLGLASSYGILRQSGGAIEMESQVGVGTTFRLYIPRLPDADPSAAVRRAAPPDGDAPGKETILLVEDQSPVRHVTKRILTTEGYTVLTATDAVGARTMLERHGDEIALMITDVMMPGETGASLATDVSRRWPQVGVIFITGYSHTELSERDSQAVSGNVLEKPFTGSALLSRVDATLSARRLSSRSGDQTP